MPNINDEKSLLKIANIIFAFEIGQSCSITGFAPDPDKDGEAVPRAELILGLLKDLYNESFCREYYLREGKKVRSRKHLTNSIGGDVAHPIWRYSKEIRNEAIKYNIWRVQ